MSFRCDPKFTDAANKAAELQRALECEQWKLMRLAIDMGLGSIILPSRDATHRAISDRS
jgi:hypothetical protein